MKNFTKFLGGTLPRGSLDQFLRGSLTFGNPPVDLLTHFAGSDAFHARLTTILLSTAGVLLVERLAGREPAAAPAEP